MATLTNTKIKDTYPALLKADDNGVIGITEKVITDGLGNASILSIGTQSASFSEDIQINGQTFGVGAGSVASNIAIGNSPLSSNTTGAWNIALGENALSANTIGNGNIALGTASLASITNGGSNVAIGTAPLQYIDGNQNVAIGFRAGSDLSAGGANKTAGSYNIYLGSSTYSGAVNTDNEIVIGSLAVGNGSNTATYGNNSITDHYFTSGNVRADFFYGDGSNLTNLPVGTIPTLDQVTGAGETSSVNIIINGADLGTIVNSSNTLFGDGALASFTTGSSNTAIGYQALTAVISGSGNTVIGSRALDNYTSGTANTAIGSEALGNGTTLSYNVAIGDDALFYINGSYNVALGHKAGEIRFGGGTKSAGDSNIYIGSNTVSAAADTDNEIVIGANAVGNGSNSATYGDSNITNHFFTAGDVSLQGGRFIVRESDNGNDAVKITRDADEGYVQVFSNGSQTVEIRGNGNSYFNGGNVGIGEQNPQTKLHLTDTSTDFVALRIDNANTSDTGTETSEIRFLHYRSYVAGQNDAGSIIVGKEQAWNASGNRNSFMSFSTRDGSAGVSERMRIDSSGNVGIGVSPSHKLHIYSLSNMGGGATKANAVLAIGNTAGGDALYFDANEIVSDTTLNLFSDDFTRISTAGSERMRITSGGDVMIGKQSLSASSTGFEVEPNGIARITKSGGTTLLLNRLTNDGILLDFRKDTVQVGTISTNGNSLPSDRDFKKDITDLELGLDFVSTLSPKKYRYKISDDNSPLLYGIIAQDLEQSLLDFGVNQNEAVLLQSKEKETEQDSGYALDYLKLTPILINAIKELRAEIETLKSQLNA